MNESLEDRLQQRPFGAYRPNPFLARLIEGARRNSGKTGGALISSVFRRMARLVIGRGPVDFGFHGSAIRFYPSGNTAEKRALLNPACFDVEELSFLDETLTSDSIFVDVGANVGLYSFAAASRIQEKGAILCFEPNPLVYARLMENREFNAPELEGRMHLFPFAVSDQAGTVQFAKPTRNLGEGKVIEDGGDRSDIIEVQSVLLHEVLAREEISKIDVLKIDIEGHEIAALRPFYEKAPQTLFPRHIIIERGGEEHWVPLEALLLGQGYKVKTSTHMNVILEIE